MSGLRNESAAMMVSRGVNKNASHRLSELTRTPGVGTKWLRNNWSGPPTNKSKRKSKTTFLVLQGGLIGKG